MKLTLHPDDGKAFTPAELLAHLRRWVRPHDTGTLTARCTLGGKIKELTIEVPQNPENTP